MLKKFTFIILASLMAGMTTAKADQLQTWPAPEGAVVKNDFEVQVSTDGRNWQNVPTHMVKVDEVIGGKHHFEEASMAYFDFEGKVFVKVRSLSAHVQSARIRPLSYEIENKVKKDCISFQLTTQLPTGGSDGVTIRNVKSISHYGWGDGMNIFASSNVLFDRVFCRNSDDCTTVYATRKGYTGSSRHITMQNSTLWADVAHPIFMGIHGNALTSIICGYSPERKVSGIVFENLKINGVLIYETMPGKPTWYKTGDMAGIWVGEHATDVKFIKVPHEN